MIAVETRTLVVVSAGVSEPSSTRLLADRIAVSVDRHLRDAGQESRIETIEIRPLAQDLASHVLAGFAPPALQTALDTVLAADGVVAVTPIFSASYSGLFKLFFDLVDRDAFEGKPVLLAATGGTARHSLAIEHAMRPLFAYLKADSMPTGVYAATEDWATGTVAMEGGLVGRIDRAAAQLARAMAARPKGVPRDEFADPVPFEDLLPRRS
ncbi:MAG TPA: FMN reductase [Candidatus Saccharimonadales bacterium]|nr:FMN reductase [Candidatus Saccharimonadales bacterium]